MLLATATGAESDGTLTKGNGWDYIRLGNPNDVTTTTRGGILFAGGSTDVDAAYQWMCAKANGGDFLVIRANGTAAYNPYIRGLCPALNSVATLIVYSRTGAGDRHTGRARRTGGRHQRRQCSSGAVRLFGHYRFGDFEAGARRSFHSADHHRKRISQCVAAPARH